MAEKDVLILAIESSCDETAAAVVKNGREVLSNVISSQIALHTLYGGVVPEIASRKHIEKINQVVQAALDEANVTLDDITAIGVTYGPGLVGALLVGVAEAKAIAYAAKKPLVGVHHIEGHIAANFIEHKDLEPPFFSLVVSGGHTHLVRVKDYGKFDIIGRTRDDAAGEAFDKVARAIGLGYPGGPKIDKVSKEGNPEAIAFPRAHVELHQRLPDERNRIQPGRYCGIVPESRDRCSCGKCDACSGRISCGQAGDCRWCCIQQRTSRNHERGVRKERGRILLSVSDFLYRQCSNDWRGSLL